MSFVIAAPETLVRAASDLANIGSTLGPPTPRHWARRRNFWQPVLMRCRRPSRRCSPRMARPIRR